MCMRLCGAKSECVRVDTATARYDRDGEAASLRTLRRVADALGADVKVSLVPRQAKPARKGSRRT